MILPRHPLLRPHLPVLGRLAVFGTLVWAVLHATVVAGVMATGGGGIYAIVRAGIVGMTALLVWVDLRAAGRILFHANLGLDARLLMAAALVPGALVEILLHARQVSGG